MKTINAIFFVILLTLAFVTAAETATDETIKETLIRSMRYRHSEAMEHEQGYAFRISGYDTNRFVRLAKEVASSNANAAWSMLLLIGKYGSTNDLDFISGYLKNADAGGCAASAYYDICGASSNSIAAAAQFLACDSEADVTEKKIAMITLIKRFRAGYVPSNLYSYAYSTVLSFAASATNEICSIDSRILPFYPSYSNSVERLAILTNAVARGVNEYELRYLTNAIHHIELP